MSGTNLAVIFIDGLPFAAGASVMPTGASIFRMRAGLGYSVNAKAELFAGLLPDDLGVLNEFSLANTAPGWTPQHLLAPLDRSPALSWVVRRVVRRIRGGQVDNIPFRQRGRFVRRGETAYDAAFDHPTLIQKFAAVHTYAGVSVTDRDGAVAEAARSSIGAGVSSVFAAFPDLDRTLHQHGFLDGHYEERIAWYRDMLLDVSTRVACTLVVSDHGMVPVDRLIDVWRPLDALARHEPVTFFIDSTMVRLWGSGSSVPACISDLAAQHGVQVVSEPEREAFGVRSRAFGDHILLAPEGSVFSPNSYGRVRGFRPGAIAMHGYHPSGIAQLGVFAGFGRDLAELELHAEPEFSTVGVYHSIGAALARASKA